MLFSGRRYVFDFLLKKILFPSTANRDQEIESRDQDLSQSEFVDFRQHTKTDRKSCISFVEAFLLSKVKLFFSFKGKNCFDCKERTKTSAGKKQTINLMRKSLEESFAYDLVFC